jgi:protein-S-isoprenylcysteine O-methyltransferase Ste14
MLLGKRLQTQGDFLFRWRGLLPFALVPAALAAMFDSADFMDHWFGPLFEASWEFLSVVCVLAGGAIRVLVAGTVPAGTSGRITKGQKAATLNVSGMYSIVRNPLYLGNFLILLGFVIETEVWWFVLLTCILFAAYYERIILREEAFLTAKFGDAYLAWAAKTPAFFPAVWRWRKPELPFSFRTALRREYNGMFLVVVVYGLLEFIPDIIEGDAPGQWHDDWTLWMVVLCAAIPIWLFVRTLKKRRLLHVAGR